MSIDVTWKAFDREKHYRGVVQQQGRVKVDADFNENAVLPDLPKPDEPLNCTFQKREAKDIECRLTEHGRVADLGKCLIDICPIYQTWESLRSRT